MQIIIISLHLTNSFHDNKNRFLKKMYYHIIIGQLKHRFEIHKQKILDALSDISQIHRLIR